MGSQEDRTKSPGTTSLGDPSGTLVLHQESLKPNADASLQTRAETTHSGSSKINGTMKEHPGSQPPVDNAGFSHLSSPSTTSFSPGRYFTSNADSEAILFKYLNTLSEQILMSFCVCLRFNTQGEYDPRFNFSGQGLMPITELNPRSLWKQVWSYSNARY